MRHAVATIGMWRTNGPMPLFAAAAALAMAAGLALGQVGGAGSPDMKGVGQESAPRPSETQPRPEPGAEKGARVDLRPRFKQGETIRYIFEQNAHSAVKAADSGDASMDQDQKQTTRIGLVMKVTEAGDTGATIQVVYESIKVTLTTPDGVSEFDSTKPAAKQPAAPAQPNKPAAPARSTPSQPAPATPATPAADPLKDIADLDTNGMLGLIVGPMVGTTITVKTDKNGAVTAVNGGEALGGALGGLGAAAGAGMMPQPQAMANWLVSGVGGPGNQGFARVGESWTKNDALTGTPVGSFRMVTTHTLKSAAGGVANVSFTGHVEKGSEGAQPGQSAGQVQSAQYNGTYAWDTRSGTLSEMATDMRVVLDAGVMGAKGRLSSETQVKVKRQP